MPVDHAPVLHLVGVPHVEGGDGGVFPAKGYLLLLLLILSAGHRASRQTIAALFWDDASDDKALTSLRQLLMRVRRSWPHEDALVETEGALLKLGPGAQHCDLTLLLEQQKSPDLESKIRSVLMAVGDLVDAIECEGSELTQWLRGVRERFRHSVLATGTEVLKEMTRFGNAREQDVDAIGERMLALEPEREESYRALIEAYGRSNRLAAVKQTYAKLTEVLRHELNVEPKSETQAALRRILASAPNPVKGAIKVGADLSAGKMLREIYPARSVLGNLPRVALLSPVPLPGQALHVLHKALIEDVANDLSRHRTFAVIAPNSSFGAAGPQDVEHLAALRAGYLISGFLVPGTEKLALRMINQPEGEIVWAAEYSVPIKDLSSAFSMITHQIAANLATAIERDQLDRFRRNPGPDAYRHYLEGQVYLKNCDLAKLRRARSEFRKSVECDPEFSSSHARIAQTLHLEWLMLGGTDPYLLNMARVEAEAAIAIDPANGVAHWMTAVVALYQRDFDASEEKFLEAENLNPHSADLLAHHGDALAHLGKADAGWNRFQRALELNPFPPDFYWWCGATIAIRQREFKTAIHLCERMNGDDAVLRLLAVCHGHLGNISIARQYGRRLREMYPGVSAIEMAKMAPDRRSEDITLRTEGFRIAGLD